ncbi:MAG: shikimate dehydrogenase [Methylobacillus sp.]|jgi:shikimate dehydrogenase|nr:shikimate dehydrogenase [Methylobacillus sp.]
MDRYAVIGNPVAHSKSPAIHAEFARQTGQALEYGHLFAPLDAFRETALHFRDEGGKGLNVTVPFKNEAFALATALTERARNAEAVNTLVFDRDNILGDNTDGAGLIRDLIHNLGFTLRHKRILLLGAGGAAQGVLFPLLHENPAQIVIANRTPERAMEMQRKAQNPAVEARTFETLAELTFDLVINATSAGLSNSALPISGGIFAPDALAYDMLYGRDTPFMQFARAENARVADGLGMLVEQAAESFHLWRGVRPDTRAVIEKLRQ